MLAGSLPSFNPYTSQCFPALEAIMNDDGRSLIRTLLIHRSHRLKPDDLVRHSFIANGLYLDRILSTFKTRAPILLTHDPLWNAACFQKCCRLAGIGKKNEVEYWPCTGSAECANPIRDKKEGIWTTLGFEWAL
jgi:hypothetical protein